MEKNNNENCMPHFKLWVKGVDGQEHFGEGKYKVLKAVGEFGSLSEAARKLGISYRKVWGLVRNSENILGRKLCMRNRGGTNGGQSLLTQDGERWVTAFERFSSEVEKSVEHSYKTHIAPLMEEKDA